MNEGMIMFLVYLLGWFIFSIGYYVYSVYIDEEYANYKKLCVWRAFWNGIFSWIGIVFVLAFLAVSTISFINDWVEDKLS